VFWYKDILYSNRNLLQELERDRRKLLFEIPNYIYQYQVVFKGIIEADQQMGSLKIIPSKTSIINLYHFTNSDTGLPMVMVMVYCFI